MTWCDQLTDAVGRERRGVLIALIGPPGSGKSTLAGSLRERLDATVLSLDSARARQSPWQDEADQSVTPAAIASLHAELAASLRMRHVTVVDATNAKAKDRRKLLRIARVAQARTIALTLLPALEVCLARNAQRGDEPGPSGWTRRAPDSVVTNMHAAISTNAPAIPQEGWDLVHEVSDESWGLRSGHRIARTEPETGSGPAGHFPRISGVRQVLSRLNDAVRSVLPSPYRPNPYRSIRR